MPDPLANSYYAATALLRAVRPQLQGDLTCDVLIIGGGFTGVAAALACAEKGLDVVLLEAETIGFGASGRNGGQLIPGLRWSMREIEAAFGRDRAKAVFDLAYGARDRVWARIAQHQIACDLKPGHFEAAIKPSHFRDMAREAEWLATHYGHQSQIVPHADMGRHIASAAYHGGIFDPQGGHFHPLNYVQGLARAAEAAGARLFEQSRVIQTSRNAGVTAETRGGLVRADMALLATDNWMGDLDAALGRQTIPIMNYNIATAPLAGADALLPSDAAIADSRFVLNYFRLSADKRLIFGGGEKYVERPPRDVAAFVRRHMVQVFPQLADVPIDYAWGGAVAVSRNRLPQIGRKGPLFYAHGFSGHGALVTTLAGELVAEAMAGTAAGFDVMASLPASTFPGGRWLRRPLATLGLLWYALRDRL
ncbi:MAG: NAD(P)/FAD-dependent oxidoreductase [Chakrabartia sp.]